MEVLGDPGVELHEVRAGLDLLATLLLNRALRFVHAEEDRPRLAERALVAALREELLGVLRVVETGFGLHECLQQVRRLLGQSGEQESRVTGGSSRFDGTEPAVERRDEQFGRNALRLPTHDGRSDGRGRIRRGVVGAEVGHVMGTDRRDRDDAARAHVDPAAKPPGERVGAAQHEQYDRDPVVLEGARQVSGQPVVLVLTPFALDLADDDELRPVGEPQANDAVRPVLGRARRADRTRPRLRGDAFGPAGPAREGQHPRHRRRFVLDQLHEDLVELSWH